MEANRKQFFQCFESVFFTLFATGCLSFRLNSEQKLVISIFTRLYTNMVRVLFPGCLITAWSIKFYNQEFSQRLRNLSPLIQFLLFAEIVVTTMTYIAVSVILDIKKHIHIDYYEQAFKLDNKMVKEFGVNFNYPKIIRKNRISITIVALYATIFYFMYMMSLDSGWKMVLFGFGYFASVFGPAISGFMHICALDYLRIRFRLFQNMFKIYLALDPKVERMQRQSIFALVNHFQKYVELIQGVNNVYGHIAFANYIHDFVHVSSMVFVFCHKGLESKAPVKEYIYLLLFILPRIVKIINTAVYSYFTVKESKICCQLIATYDYIYPVKDVKESIQAFLLWKKHNGFHFTVGKVLELNYGFAYSFFQSITNYVIIWIQLKIQEGSIKDRLQGKIYSKDLKD